MPGVRNVPRTNRQASRELLLRADPDLRAGYRDVYQRRLAQWVWFGEQLVAQGVIRAPQPPAPITDLAIAVWLIAGNWLPFLEITGDPQDPRQVAHAGEVLLAVLSPYLARPGGGREEER